MRARHISNEEFSINVKAECGHAHEMHVTPNVYDLKKRIINENRRVCGDETRIPYATRFLNEKMACMFIKKTLQAKEGQVKEWLKWRDTEKISIEASFSLPVGEGLARGTNYNNVYKMYNCTVVLRLGYNSDLFEIITAYPSPNKKGKEEIQKGREEYNSSRRQKK